MLLYKIKNRFCFGMRYDVKYKNVLYFETNHNITLYMYMSVISLSLHDGLVMLTNIIIFILFLMLCFLIWLRCLLYFIGFISIDCGITNGTSYIDSKTGILYVSDHSYIDTGINYNISKSISSPTNQSSSLRSFSNNETRNCYTLRNLTKGGSYLLRATFLYGNYDGQQMTQIQFDLYLNISFWRRVDITNASMEYSYEIVTQTASDFMWLCLVDINAGTPFISALELRPLKGDLSPSPYDDISYAILFRFNCGPTQDATIR
jgi:Malectin-like domain